MLSESDQKEFKKLAASYMNALSALNHKDDEIYRFAETCGAYEDWRVLAKIILPLPDLCRARSHLIRKYYELRDEPPLGLGEWPPLERKTQIRINTLASAYERLLNEKRRLHHEILGLAKERGVFEDEDSLEEILSFVDTACYLRLLLAERLRILHKIQADQDNAVSHQKGEEPCSEEPAPSPYHPAIHVSPEKGHRNFYKRKEAEMVESTVKASTKYLEELSILLRSQGFTVHPKETRDIDVEHDGSTLCRINDLGNLGYFADKIAGKESVLDRIRETARSTREYMTLLEQAPPLVAEGLSEGYQLLAEFNGTVLAGHMTRYGAQFVTWEWVHNKTALWQGHYYGVGDSGGYSSAKRDFAVRSGLLPSSGLFTQEQLTEVYRSIHEALDSEYPLTDERRKLLESAAEQIEDFVPDLDERVQRSNQAELDAPRGGGMELS